MRVPRLTLVIFLTLLSFARYSYAEGMSSIDRQTSEIADVTMSPFCPGRTISACPSPAAKDLRDQIHDWFEQGYSKTAVINQLRTIYGDDVLGAPPAKGFNLLAWISPILFLVFGLCLIIALLYTLKTPKKTAEGGGNLAPELAKELEEEIKNRLKS